MSTKVWYLAAGQKKVGPLSARRVAKRMAAGKVPPGTMAWKEGMTSWMPVAEIPELALEVSSSGDDDSDLKEASAVVEEPAVEEKPKKKTRKSKKATGKVAVAEAPKKANKAKTRSAARAACAPSDEAFQALYRIEKPDVMRAFGLGLDRDRVLLVLATAGLTAGTVGGLIGIGLLATKLHMLLALPFVLAAGVAGMVLGPVSMGALSYHSRHQLGEQEPPTIKESIQWALSRKKALALTPLALGFAWLAPLIALGILTAVVKIPYAGPLATGLTFGAHIGLSALTFFLILTLIVSSVLGPVVVAFEGTTTVKQTLTVLMDFVKRSTARLMLWGWWPNLLFTPFCVAVLLGAVLILAPPVGLTVALAGGKMMLRGGLDTSLLIGLVPAAIWIGAFLAAAFSIPVSVNNAILSLLYLGGRKGNDDLITRDAWLAQRQEG